MPLGSLSFTLDPLAALFLLPVFILTGLSAIYGADYLKSCEGKKPLGLAWAAFNILTASMVVVFTASNAVLFMLGWELMAAASFLLVLFDHEKEQSRRAAFIYISAGGTGALLLLAAFSLLSQSSPGLDFAHFVAPSGGLASAVFLLALVGFGLKAGVIPLHVWLPEAHPAAPSQVSAVMSGVMIKTGIYGLIRVLGFLSPWQEWWGWTMLLAGAASCVLGALFALAQHELKRVLAYSSIEHMGILALGAGLGGGAVFGALLGALSHSLTKAGLFFTSGLVLAAEKTKRIAEVKGLWRRAPRTAALWLTGFFLITGTPPSGVFLAKFIILKEALAQRQYALAAVFLLCLAILFSGMARYFISMTFGERVARPGEKPYVEEPGLLLPAAALFACVVLAGLFMPDWLGSLLAGAALNAGGRL